MLGRMRTRWWVGGALLAAAEAAAADSAISPGVPIVVVFLAVGVAAAVVFWAMRRLREERAARHTIAAEHEMSRAALAASPAALWRRRADGSEEFTPGALPPFATLSAARLPEIL